jgi:hypothetical protein
MLVFFADFVIFARDLSLLKTEILKLETFPLRISD